MMTRQDHSQGEGDGVDSQLIHLVPAEVGIILAEEDLHLASLPVQGAVRNVREYPVGSHHTEPASLQLKQT